MRVRPHALQKQKQKQKRDDDDEGNEDEPAPAAEKYAVKRTAAETFAEDVAVAQARQQLAKTGAPFPLGRPPFTTAAADTPVKLTLTDPKKRAADAFAATVIRNEVSDNCIHEVGRPGARRCSCAQASCSA